MHKINQKIITFLPQEEIENQAMKQIEELSRMPE